MEVLNQWPIQRRIYRVAILKYEVFMFSMGDNITVHNRNNMIAARHVTPLTGIITFDMAACIPFPTVCMYYRCIHRAQLPFNHTHYTKDKEHRFGISSFITDLKKACSTAVATRNCMNGRVCLRMSFSTVLSIGANGGL